MLRSSCEVRVQGMSFRCGLTSVYPSGCPPELNPVTAWWITAGAFEGLWQHWDVRACGDLTRTCAQRLPDRSLERCEQVISIWVRHRAGAHPTVTVAQVVSRPKRSWSSCVSMRSWSKTQSRRRRSLEVFTPSDAVRGDGRLALSVLMAEGNSLLILFLEVSRQLKASRLSSSAVLLWFASGSIAAWLFHFSFACCGWLFQRTGSASASRSVLVLASGTF